MVKLEGESFFFEFSAQVVNQLSLFRERSISVVHDLPLDLRVQPADKIVKSLPEESSDSFTAVEQEIISLQVLIMDNTSQLCQGYFNF